MTLRQLLSLTVVLGLGLFGAGGFSRIGASDRSSPAYFVTIFESGSASEIMDTSYPSLFPATFQPFGGRYVIHFGAGRTFDGQPPEQVVVIRFDNMRQLLAWHSSDSFKTLYDVHKIGNVRAFAVEGIPTSGSAPPNS